MVRMLDLDFEKGYHIRENETLLDKIRESNAKGPFRIEVKELGAVIWRSDTRPNAPFRFSTPQEVADFLSDNYLGPYSYSPHDIRPPSWKIVGQRRGLTGGQIYKLEAIPASDSINARNNYPPGCIQLRVKPSPV